MYLYIYLRIQIGLTLNPMYSAIYMFRYIDLDR